MLFPMQRVWKGGGAVAVCWKHIISQWWFGAIPFQMASHSFLLVSIFSGDLYMRCCCILVPVVLLLIAFSAFLGGDFCRIAWLITTVAIRNNNWTMPTMPSLTMMEMRSEHIQIRLRRPQRPSSLFSTCNIPPPLIWIRFIVVACIPFIWIPSNAG